jgi:hypothetical protein
VDSPLLSIADRYNLAVRGCRNSLAAMLPGSVSLGGHFKTGQREKTEDKSIYTVPVSVAAMTF